MADTPNTETAELESGYSDDKPTVTPAVVEPVVEASAAAVEPVEAPDPFKQVLERLDKFEQTTSKLAGHIGGLQRGQNEISQTLAAARAATKAVGDAPTAAQVQSAIENPKEWDEIREEFPAFSSAMEKLLDHKLATQKAPLASADIEKTVDERLQAQISAQAKARIDEVSEIHPGWQADLYGKDAEGAAVRTPAYEAWAKTMTPQEVAKFENSNSVLYVDRKLSEFYAWKKAQAALATEQPKPPVSTRQKRLEAAVTPRGTGGHASSGSSEIDEMEAGYSS